MNKHSLSTALAIAVAIASTKLHAEQLYVDDKLVLNVYSDADQGGSRVATIETGDAVEAIERVEKFVHIRLADGREGWVGANYLTSQPPAIVRLKELQAGQTAQSPAQTSEAPKQLTDEIARLKKQNTSLNAEVTELKKKAAATPLAPAAAAPVNASTTPASLAASEPEEQVQPAPVVVIQRSYWWAWLLAVIAAGGSGFFVGYQTLGRRVRERFGGVKVY